MAKKYRVEMQDGRVFQVEADNQPSEEEILSYLHSKPQGAAPTGVVSPTEPDTYWGGVMKSLKEAPSHIIPDVKEYASGFVHGANPIEQAKALYDAQFGHQKAPPALLPDGSPNPEAIATTFPIPSHGDAPKTAREIGNMAGGIALSGALGVGAEKVSGPVGRGVQAVGRGVESAADSSLLTKSPVAAAALDLLLRRSPTEALATGTTLAVAPPVLRVVGKGLQDIGRSIGDGKGPGAPLDVLNTRPTVDVAAPTQPPARAPRFESGEVQPPSSVSALDPQAAVFKTNVESALQKKLGKLPSDAKSGLSDLDEAIKAERQQGNITRTVNRKNESALSKAGERADLDWERSQGAAADKDSADSLSYQLDEIRAAEKARAIASSKPPIAIRLAPKKSPSLTDVIKSGLEEAGAPETPTRVSLPTPPGSDLAGGGKYVSPGTGKGKLARNPGGMDSGRPSVSPAETSPESAVKAPVIDPATQATLDATPTEPVVLRVQSQKLPVEEAFKKLARPDRSENAYYSAGDVERMGLPKGTRILRATKDVGQEVARLRELAHQGHITDAELNKALGDIASRDQP